MIVTQVSSFWLMFSHRLLWVWCPRSGLADATTSQQTAPRLQLSRPASTTVLTAGNESDLGNQGLECVWIEPPRAQSAAKAAGALETAAEP